MLTVYAIYRRFFNRRWYQRKTKRVTSFYLSEERAIEESLYGTRGVFYKGPGEYIIKEITINIFGYLIPIALIVIAGLIILS